MSQQPKTDQRNMLDPHVIAEVTIPPNELRKVKLGVFTTSDPTPRFHTQWNPKDAPHVVTQRDVEIDHDDDTHSIYRHFQNFGDRPCTVTIIRR